MRKFKCTFFVVSILSMATLSKLNAQNSNWSMQSVPIKTRWARKVNPLNVLPEYPRPQMVRRNTWQNLNGLWNYSITTDETKIATNYDGQILVPFPLESALSGVEKSLQPNQLLWYKRNFNYKSKNGERTLLHFGAVDWRSTVFINGLEVGEHEGGYTSFSFDITDAVKQGINEIVVKVFDPTDQGINPHGKQTLKPENIYYTSSSGIWQTVWLETVPNSFINELVLKPNIDRSSLTFKMSVNDNAKDLKAELIVTSGGHLIHKENGDPRETFHLKIPNVHLWSPEDPFLYDLTVKLTQNGKVVDQVTSYFGMRKVEIKQDKIGVERIFLNNNPYFNFGTLDQGFWPEGLYTAPTDAALSFDIKAIKMMGFNTIRKHIKIEPARWYYHADKIGILVWQDFVNPPQALPDGSKIEFEKEIKSTIDQLQNYPSITTWVLFNEKWGAFDQKRLTEWVKNYDSSRIVDGHSGELLYVNDNLSSPSPNPYENSDLTDVHSYPSPRMPMKLGRKAQICGEFGGIGVSVTGHQWDDFNGWGYIQVSSGEMEAKYTTMIKELKELKAKGLAGSIYTQPFDVEGEENGLMTYDREIIKIPIDRLRELHHGLTDLDSKGFLLNKGFFIGQKMNTINNESYSELINKFYSGKRDSAFVRKLILISFRKKDYQQLDQLTKYYISIVKNIFTKDNLNFLQRITISTKDKGFELFLNSPNNVNLVLGGIVAGKFVRSIIDGEIRPAIFDSKIKPNLLKIEAEVVRKYGDNGERVFLECVSLYYYFQKDYQNFVASKVKIHNNYPDAIPVFDMNNDAWVVFENVNDKEQLEAALSWSQKVIEKEPTANYYDTYANILYKLGRTNDAIKAQEKGLSLDQGNGSVDDIKKNLEKMKLGEKTWQ